MIKGLIVGEAEVMAKLEALGPRLKEEMAKGIGRLALKLNRDVQRDKLSGQVLKVRTGRLRRSIHDATVEEDGKTVGIVSSNVSYAAFQEFGFDGTETVKAHLRRSRGQFALRKTTKSGRETAASARKAAGTGSIEVREFTRKVNYPAHSFLRTALAEMEAAGVIITEMNAAIKRAKK